MGQLYWLFSYASKYFVTNHHCKTQAECSDLKNNIIYWTTYSVQKLNRDAKRRP